MFTIDDRRLGESEPPYIIAEAGVHHENSLPLAEELMVQARIAGADAVKFQTYTADRLAARWAPTYWSSEEGLTQHDIFQSRSLLSAEDYGRLASFAKELGITFLSTPFDIDSAKMLHELAMPAFKIASADLTNHPLLKAVAGMGRPVLLSTGASKFEEIERAVQLILEAGVPLALLHCSLSYPTPVRKANLDRIRALRKEFPSILLGYSDHTRPQDSFLPCPAAVVLGARVIEKHFTLNKCLEGDDHDHAVDPEGLADLVRDCRDAFEMTRPYSEMTEIEGPARQYARRSIVAARALPEGHVLEEGDVDFKRPGTGLSPERVDEVLGRALRRDVRADELVDEKDLA